MKKMIIVFTMIGINAFAQFQTLSEAQLQRKYPTTLKVTKVEQSRTKNNTFKTDYGSKDYEYDKQLSYTILFQYRGKGEQTFTIDWKFIGADLAQKNKLVVFDSGSKSVTVTNDIQKIDISCEKQKSRKANYVALGLKEREGINPKGIVVSVKNEKDQIVNKFLTNNGIQWHNFLKD